ncbi:hypothetical protein D3C71_1717180 [compost metagenome]
MRFGAGVTVSRKVWLALPPRPSDAVNVMFALPTFAGVTVKMVPFTETAATLLAEETAV